jgi:hypothetical protein
MAEWIGTKTTDSSKTIPILTAWLLQDEASPDRERQSPTDRHFVGARCAK